MPDPEVLQSLKELALLGASTSFIEASSSNLAERLRTSQQTAARRILDLERAGFIRREKGVRSTLVRITEEGVALLLDEFSAYKQIFERSHHLRIKGKVASGLGEGRYYLDQKGYIDQFQAKLGFHPYPGTLNVEIRGSELNKLRILKAAKPIPIEAFQDKERTFGAVDAWRARIRGIEGAAIIPRRTHHTRTLEVISARFLREALSLKDGDELEVEVQLE